MTSHIVKFGETLWSIASDYGVSFFDLVHANQHLSDPDVIFPGQTINVPEKTDAQVAHTAISTQAASGKANVGATVASEGAFCSPVDRSSHRLVPFGWNDALSYCAVYGSGFGQLSGLCHSGVDISRPGCEGQAIYAIGDGRIAYAGNPSNDWGWGNIIILRLADCSVRYAHMQSIAVRTGQNVQQGDVLGGIGCGEKPCGEKDAFAPHLHFDARRAPYTNVSLTSAATAKQIKRSFINPYSLYA